MSINKDDTFPLWSFGYKVKPLRDRSDKVMTSRGRTWQEAWHFIQFVSGPSFLEPEKVGLRGSVSIEDKESYTKIHQYDWFHDAPLWLKIKEGRLDLIW